MKKTLIAVAAAAALTTSAFAEITFGGWGRGVLVPVASNGDGTQAFQSTSWGGQPRVGFELNGVSDNVGIRVTMNADDGSGVAIHDEAKIWVKPFDFLKIQAGKIQNNTLRGDWCFGSWNWLRPSWINDEGITFSNFEKTGMQVELFPVEGLYIAVGVPLKKNGWDPAYSKDADGNYNGGEAWEYDKGKDDDKYAGDAGDTYRASVVQAAYTIAGIGQIKAAYRGSNELVVDKDGDKKYKKGVIEAAFASKGDNALVENLGFEVGVAYDLTSKDDGGAATKVAMGVSYSGIEKLGLNANAAVFLPKDTDENSEGHKNKTYVQAGVGVDYAVADGVTLNADCRFETSRASEKDPAKDDDPTKVGFLVGAAKGFSNGKVGIGFQATTKGGFVGGLKGTDKGNAKDKMTWAVPVVLEYWF
ncbi:MAG: hypothetical protein MST12_01290 [Spirochaetia bacterium]|nr:hypothetical protein [Spirochaetia bacterium]